MVTAFGIGNCFVRETAHNARALRHKLFPAICMRRAQLRPRPGLQAHQVDTARLAAALVALPPLDMVRAPQTVLRNDAICRTTGVFGDKP